MPTAVLDDTITHIGGFFSLFMISWLLNFDISDITNYIEITQSVMPKTVYLLTVQEAHMVYNSLVNQIQVKYGSCEPTLPETEPATSKGIIQAHILQALKMPFGSKLQ